MSRHHKHPFFVLDEIDQHYRKRSIDSTEAAPPQFAGLGIIVGGSRRILSTNQLSEVLRLDKKIRISAIPSTHPWHKGLISIHGQLVSIIDLSAYLMEKATEITKKTRILVVRRETDYSGLLVDEVAGLIKRDDSLENNPGSLRLDGCDWDFLDLEALFADPNFTQVATS